MCVNTRQCQGVGVRLHDARTRGTGTSIFLLHHRTNRVTPTPIWIGEEVGFSSGTLFQFDFAITDFATGVFRCQRREIGVAYAVSANLESLARQFSHLIPVEHGTFGTPGSLLCAT